jgi:hypothetical protein
MPERFDVYRYEIRRAGEAPETRWSFVPVKPAGYAGNDEPDSAHPMGSEPADVGEMRPAGQVEAPDGTTIASYEPPILEIPGRGRINLLGVMGVGEGETSGLAELVRFRAA